MPLADTRHAIYMATRQLGVNSEFRIDGVVTSLSCRMGDPFIDASILGCV